MKYHGQVTIDPSKGHLTAQLTLTWCAAKQPLSVWNFYLYHSLSLKAITCNIPIKYHHESSLADWSPFIHESRQLQVLPQGFIDPNQKIELTLCYEGYIDIVSKWEVNRISLEWVELGLYAPWYPLREDLPPSTFTIEVYLPPEYQIISGHVTKAHDHWVIQSVIPNYDCTLLASPNVMWLTAEASSLSSRVYYTSVQHQAQAQLAAEFSQDIITFFNELIGTSGLAQQHIVFAPRTKGGGYCRPGLIVMTPAQKPQPPKLFAYLAHETAHLWWYRADTGTWEDWLNESFAEYCALLALRQRFGAEAFQSKLSDYGVSIQNTPGIKGLARTHPQAHTVLYKKGPLLLHALAERVGLPAFKALLQEMHAQQIKTHHDFLQVLQHASGEETASWFDHSLEE